MSVLVTHWTSTSPLSHEELNRLGMQRSRDRPLWKIQLRTAWNSLGTWFPIKRWADIEMCDVVELCWSIYNVRLKSLYPLEGPSVTNLSKIYRWLLNLMYEGIKISIHLPVPVTVAHMRTKTEFWRLSNLLSFNDPFLLHPSPFGDYILFRILKPF